MPETTPSGQTERRWHCVLARPDAPSEVVSHEHVPGLCYTEGSADEALTDSLIKAGQLLSLHVAPVPAEDCALCRALNHPCVVHLAYERGQESNG